MITKKELIENGFSQNGEWNNRIYYSKKGFRIVSHCGIYRCDDKNWSGYGSEIKTIDELNNLYENYLDEKIKQLEILLTYFKQND